VFEVVQYWVVFVDGQLRHLFWVSNKMTERNADGENKIR